MALKGQGAEYLGEVLLRLPFRFVSDTDECILWPTARQRDGYGFMRVQGKRLLAHRVIWQKANGRAVPAGMLVMHTCDNRICVNPNHLEIGSHKDNVLDCVRKGRRNQARGTRCPHAKLNEEQINTLRECYRQSQPCHETLARMFGVTRSAISQVLRGKTWNHVPGEPVVLGRAMRKGTDHPEAKLTNAQVLEIRHRRTEGEQGKELARIYAVSTSTICAVTRRHTWKHI